MLVHRNILHLNRCLLAKHTIYATGIVRTHSLLGVHGELCIRIVDSGCAGWPALSECGLASIGRIESPVAQSWTFQGAKG
jgi:hypothetical protein